MQTSKEAVNDFRPEVRSLLKELKLSGFKTVSANNGGGDDETIKADDVTTNEFIQQIVATDSASLTVEYEQKFYTIFIVLGNEPGEIVCDHTEFPLLSEVVDRHYDKWESKKQPVSFS
jgi:hypothetical protein